MAISLKHPKTVNFSHEHIQLFPLHQQEKKYPKELAVFQNIFWKLTHEKPLKDDLLKLLFFFSPKIRLTENDLSEKKSFTITAKEYAQLTQIKQDSAYVTLSRAVDILYEHSVRFFHEETQQTIRTRLINSCAYADGVFSVSFTHYALHIMSVFNKDNPFTQLKVKSVMALNGYALKIYPMFIQNEYRKIFEVDITDLKIALNINVASYSDFKEFKKNVLKPSIDNINSNTELNVSYKAIKKSGRKATHVEFTVTKKSTVKPEQAIQAVQPTEQVKPLDIYKAISNNNLLPRFLQHGESTEDLINRIKSDFKNDQSDLWINKLLEFDITF
jgi:plasmid replication initiation protein